jgi:anti-anti-sigma factor
MEIDAKVENKIALLALSGRLDTNTSGELEARLAKDFANGATSVVLDFNNLDYISSAGLRVLLGTHKQVVASGGELTIKNIRPEVREVFDVTGFSNILNVQ